MELKVVDTPDRKSVNRNDRWSDLATIILKESSERAILSQREELSVLVLKRRNMKTGSKGIQSYRLKTLRKPLYESIEPTSSEHGEPLDVT
jgi:hypothetical protein